MRRAYAAPLTGAQELTLPTPSSGQPLPGALRTRFEASLGADLSAVRVHTGTGSATAAAAVGARAFAVGDDIHFGDGQYRPDDPFATHLIAHEVAHTVQQRGGATGVQAKLEISEPADALEHQADAAAEAMVHGQPAAVGPAPASIQRAPDPAEEVRAVKSKEIELAEQQETTDWPGVVARLKHRKKDIDDYLKTKLPDDTRAVLQHLHTRWDGTVVAQASFDPVTGVLDAKQLRVLLQADDADAKKLTRRFASVKEWVGKLRTALGAFLELRQRLDEERTEFHRFDDAFLDKDVITALSGVPGGFRPADLKAMLGKETGDFTDINIAGIDSKSKGIVQRLEPHQVVGVGQIGDDTDKDAHAMAAKLGITLPARAKGKADPRRIPATGIKIAASYLAYIGTQLSSLLPATPPTSDVEMRKLVLAAYNGGPFGLIAAAKEVAGKGGAPYTWASISKSEQAMSNFLKPRDVKEYVKSVMERAP